MKKFKLLVFVMMSSMTLIGCRAGGAANTGKLPSGGESVDLKTEEGKTILKDRVNNAVKAYADLKLESISVTSTTSGVTATASTDFTMQGLGNVKMDAGIKDFGAKVELKAAKNDKYLDGSLVVSTTGGNIYAKGSLPGLEQGKVAKIDANLSLKGAKASAYLDGSEGKAYVDLSNSGNEKLVKNAESFANTLMDQLTKSSLGAMIPTYLDQAYGIEEFYNKSTKQFDFVTPYNKYLPEKKMAFDLGTKVEFPEEELGEALSQLSGFEIDLAQIEQVAEMLYQLDIGFEFVVYKNNAFGFSVGMDKNSLKTILNTAGGEDAAEAIKVIDSMVDKFSVNASVYFNKNFLLESAGFSADIALKIDSLADLGLDQQTAQMFESFKASAQLKGKESIAIKYNSDKVSLPNFSDYKAMN